MCRFRGVPAMTAVELIGMMRNAAVKPLSKGYTRQARDGPMLGQERSHSGDNSRMK